MPPLVSTAQLKLPVEDTPDSSSTLNSTVFTDNMKLPIHGWFRFSAGYSGEWAEALIREKAVSQHVRVLDPFVGSGTTAVAAQAAGAEGIGLESHPFYSRLGQAKVSWPHVDPQALKVRAQHVLAQAQVTDDLDSVAPLLAKCFEPARLSELWALRESVERTAEGDQVDNLLWLALVSILRRCSHVGTAQWQYVLPNRRKAKVAEPLHAFRDQIGRMISDIESMQTDDTIGAAQIYCSDARTCEGVEDDWANLVVTSPPYPNNFDYADAARLEMTFLGDVESWGDLQQKVRVHLVRSCSQHMVRYDLAAAMKQSVLSPIIQELTPVIDQLTELRDERAGKKAYNSMIAAYFIDLAETWYSLRRACAPGATICFVVGDSAPYGVHVPVERWLGELAIAAGFKSWTFEKLRDRNIKWKNRKHRVPLQEGRLWLKG